MSTVREEKRYNFEPLLKERAESAEATREKLDRALNRFEEHRLKKLPAGSKLTVRNLAVEAGVNKDTSLSRFRKPHPKADQYRFPKIADRFKKLKKKKLSGDGPGEKSKEEIIEEVGGERDLLRAQSLAAAQVNNRLDAENYDLTKKCREQEEEIARLRQESLKVVSINR